MKKNDLTEFKKVFNQIKLAKKLSVNIGLPKDVGEYPNGESIVAVGERHEFGLGVPRRSFLRMPMIKKQRVIDKAVKVGWKKIVDGKSTTIKQYNILGQVGRNISLEAFKTGGFGNWKALDEKTVTAKGEDKILMDTGKLRQSITYWVGKA